MRLTKLGEVCEVISKGTTPSTLGFNYITKGGVPFLRAEDIQGGAVDLADVKFRIQPETHASLSRSHLHSGDLLITIAGTLGRVGYIPKTTTPINCNQAVAFARLKTDLADLKYVCYACQSAAVLRPLLDQQKLGTIGNLNLEQLNNLEIPLPDLSEQRRIAGELERADGLRRTRRYALELADTFLPAAFLQLFGDLIHNERKWEFRELDEMADIASGIAKGQKYGDRQTREVPYLRVANVQDGYLNLMEIKTIQALPADIEHLRLQKDDIVMTEGGDFDKLGRGAIWPGGVKDCIHQNHIFRVRLDQSELLPQFFAAFLRSPCAKNYFLRCSKQTTNLASINMTQLRATPTPVPPLPLQTRFAELVERHERLRSVQRESLRQAEHLFQSLLHRFFL